MIKSYGRKDGLKGLESNYEFRGDELYIKIQGSNSWQDYFWDFLAFPRKHYNGKKYHYFWFKQSKKFADFLKTLDEMKQVKKVFVVGHSMGGANAAVLPVFFPDKFFDVKLINSPRMGNKKAMEWLNKNSNTILLYDKGDVVRLLPPFYGKYIKKLSYGKTKPFWKAHVNFPSIWRDFFSKK